MKKITVFGTGGQLGSEIRELSKNYDYEFLFLSSSDLDITDSEKVNKFVSKNKPNYIINCAAYTAVDKAESDQEKAFLVNETGVKNIALACENSKTHFVHVSTDFVYDGEGDTPFKEEGNKGTLAVYADSKLAGEKALESSNANYNIFRISWVYSFYGNNFVKTMMKYGKERGELNVVNDQIGSPTYAFDFAKFLLDYIEHFPKHNREIFNYSNQGSISWYDFASKIMDYASIDCQVNPIPTSGYPTPAMRPKYSVMDKTKVEETFGCHLPEWEESLQACIKRLSQTKN